MEQHPVPQNVTTFQFRLIGDMTIKQFGYLAGGALLGYIFYKTPLPIFIGLPLGVGTFLLGFGFAFVPVEERPMDVWFFSFIKSIYNPTFYIWQREKPIAEPIDITTASPATKPSAPGTDIRASTTPVSKPAAPPPLLTQVVHKPPPPPQARPQAPPIPTPASVALQPPTALPTKLPTPPKMESQTIPASTPQPAATLPPPTPPARPPMIHSSTPHAPKKNLLSWIFDLFKFSAHSKLPPPIMSQKIPSPPVSGTGTQLPPMYAHMQTPVVTGKRLDMGEHTIAAAPLNAMNRSPVPSAAPVVVPVPQSASVTDAVNRAAAKTQDLENKLTSLQQELSQKTASDDRIVELQKQLTQVLSERQNMQSELIALKAKLEKTPTTQSLPPKTAGYTVADSSGPTVKVITPETAVRAGLPKLTTFPNIVTGIIKDNENNLLPGVLVTVRDKEDIPLRALKTNKLGQFAASTPLPSTTYFVEVEDPRNRYVFDRIQITLNDNIVPAIEIIAKSLKELSRQKLEKEIFGNQHI